MPLIDRECRVSQAVRVESELDARSGLQYKASGCAMETDCVFCRIAAGQTATEILYTTDHLVVFRDIRPQAPVHLLIVPRKHLRSVNDLEADDAPILGELFRAAQQMARRLEIARHGYRLVVNVERGGGQVIFHLHMHLIGGWGR